MKFRIQNSNFKINGKEFNKDKLIKVLLANRGIKTKKEAEEFLNPELSNITINNLAIDSRQLKKAVLRIKNAIKKKEKIVVFGDYDVDGICGTAILWETLNSLGANVMPYIPHRIDEGYGLSIAGINNVILNLFQDPKSKEIPKRVRDDNGGRLIITVDNGIVANKAVEFANKQDIDIIITDHHVPSKTLPKALAIVHTTKLCGTGVAWILSSVILNEVKNLKRSFASAQDDNMSRNYLELVALATVADLVPLKGANRTLLKFGLEQLRKTKRIGLLELIKEAGLAKESIGVYEIGHMIAPRLNAMGRLEYAMDSLRLICTTNPKRAEKLAHLLGSTNRERQELTSQTVLHAREAVRVKGQGERKLIFISHESYEQGVIGLVAGKMVEEFYRPSIVVSIGERYSKASARSISGFNMIEFIREHSSYLVDAGGHPMAAGFTFETTKLLDLQSALEKRAQFLINEKMLTRSLRVDCELPLSFVDIKLYESLQKLAPFGMGNPEPTFLSKNVLVEDVRVVGNGGKHLKIRVKGEGERGKVFEGIAFGMGEKTKIHIGDRVDIVYTIDENEWPARQSNLPDIASRGKAGAQAFAGGNGERKLQLKIRDLI